MARFDKYDPISGGFRAPLAAAVAAGAVGTVTGVSLDANGRVVVGTGGNSGFVGVICPVKTMAVGDVIDVMTDGEIVDVALAAGTTYYSDAAGALGTAAPAAGVNGAKVGHTVEADRLVVRTARVQG